MTSSKVRQRADLTFKYNRHAGRHGWLRLTPAYSVRIVEEVLAGEAGKQRVLDPFSGTATTPLCAAYHGQEGVSVDINPFLVWLGGVKTGRYEEAEVSEALDTAAAILELVGRDDIPEVPAPRIHNIERWWDPPQLRFLTNLRSALEHRLPESCPVKDILQVAFCRFLIRVSNAAFNHQSMSFKDSDDEQRPLFDSRPELAERFLRAVRTVTTSAIDNPTGSASVIRGDATDLCASVSGVFDCVVTSPPYPNRMSYIRELRPYMYWLGYLEEARDAGELDWRAIGGTWGIATSRLTTWERDPATYVPGFLETALQDIAQAESKNADLLSRYVAKYFEDIWAHLRSLTNVLKSGAHVHYIVGNSVFYGVLVPVEAVYADMLEHLGFENVSIATVRKRNSKKELFEFDVSGTWSG